MKMITSFGFKRRRLYGVTPRSPLIVYFKAGAVFFFREHSLLSHKLCTLSKHNPKCAARTLGARDKPTHLLQQ